MYRSREHTALSALPGNFLRVLAKSTRPDKKDRFRDEWKAAIKDALTEVNFNGRINFGMLSNGNEALLEGENFFNKKVDVLKTILDPDGHGTHPYLTQI